MELNAEKTRARIELNGELDAAEVDALIRQLAQLRAGMQPPVPATRRQLEATGQDVTAIEDPALLIAPTTRGSFRLWLRHSGIGWIAYDLGGTQARTSAKYILSFPAGDDEGVDLTGHEGGHRH